ncbi:MAG: hypothetical protein AAGB00_03490 [Planctomycetota bacterium]
MNHEPSEGHVSSIWKRFRRQLNDLNSPFWLAILGGIVAYLLFVNPILLWRLLRFLAG